MQRTMHFEKEKTANVEKISIVGDSESMIKLKKNILRVAESRADTVLVHGESGSGKELVARAIHEWSQHAADPFVEINCASIPENLLESELFGYERGAFTDAKDRKLGLFEIAGDGTVFLDEIGEMPAKLQAKLLRVLECRRFKRLGGTKDIEFSGRIVAATNRHLEEEITKGAFRADLYYRLNIVPIVVPPLRDRKSDIPMLVDHLLGKIAENLCVLKPQVSADAILTLMRGQWPGNVRELKNTLQRSIIFHQPKMISTEILDLVADDHVGSDYCPVVDYVPHAASVHVASVHTDDVGAGDGGDFKLPTNGIDLDMFEKSMLVQALERTRFNQTKAARLLHVTRHTLRYRLEKFGLLSGTA